MNEPAAQPAQHYDPDLSVGEILRQARLRYNLTLEQVEGAVRIRAEQLDAIEQGDISRLPGRVYAIGFVRTYATYLGLDADHLVAAFKNQSIGSKPKAKLHYPAVHQDKQLPATPYIFGGLIGAIILIFLWSIVYGEQGAVRDVIPEMPVAESDITEAPPIGIEVTEEVTEEEATPPDENILSSILTPKEPKRRVVINVKQNSWVEIRNAEGKAIVSTILKAGDQYLVPEEQGLVMATGNAGGLEIVVDGEALPTLGRIAQVKRNISLNPDDLTKNR